MKRAIDLAVTAGRKRQSPRTGFVHLCSSDESALDTIPIFENFCFAMALFRQRSIESILEGKKLVERLLAFQTSEGNFPIYLHEFSQCYDPWMGLRIAPALVQIHRHFGSCIGADMQSKILLALDRVTQFSAIRNRPSLWEHRFQKLQGKEIDFSPATSDEWFHWLIGEQLSSSPISAKIPYHPGLQAFIGGSEAQEKGEPRPHPLEWVLSESQGYNERLLRDHPTMLQSALLFPIDTPMTPSPDVFTLIPEGVRLLWNGCKKIHSLSAPGGKLLEPGKIAFELSAECEQQRDGIEAAIFCDLSLETQLTIGEKQGTIFYLGDPILIRTPALHIELRFELTSGDGMFCGQISRANRPTQTACKGPLLYEVFDWRIALRTLRRSSGCLIIALMRILHPQKGDEPSISKEVY